MRILDKTIGIGLCLIPILFLSGCELSFSIREQENHLVDKDATRETVALYNNIRTLADSCLTMFGAQMPTIHGIANGEPWYNGFDTGRSDTKDVAGSHPALYGWEIGGIELGTEKNLDGDSFEVIRAHIAAAYERGGVNTISWHCGNPVIGGKYNNTSAYPIRELLEGGSCHQKFLGYLDIVADFLASLKGRHGEAIPVIWRPWHEHTDSGKGTGFWWSVGNNSREDFIALWHMTYNYMTEQKGLHNLIWAYSPDLHHLCWGQPGIDKYMYLDAWPGDEYVDLMGLDAYETPWSNFRTKALEIVDYALSLAQEKGKPFAITETGFANNSPEHDKYGHDPRWWTEQLYSLTHGKKVSYVLIWRDDAFPAAGEPYPEYYGGFLGSYSQQDFVEYVNKEDILLEKDLSRMYK